MVTSWPGVPSTESARVTALGRERCQYVGVRTNKNRTSHVSCLNITFIYTSLSFDQAFWLNKRDSVSAAGLLTSRMAPLCFALANDRFSNHQEQSVRWGCGTICGRQTNDEINKQIIITFFITVNSSRIKFVEASTHWSSSVLLCWISSLWDDLMRLHDTHGDVQDSNSTNLQRDVPETSVWVSDWSRSEQVRSVKCLLLSDTWAACKPVDLRWGWTKKTNKMMQFSSISYFLTASD